MAPKRNALVLSGGGARGAYEVGVVRYLRGRLARRLGRPLRLDILCGTSVGAINACYLAATCDVPDRQADRLAALWTSLDLSRVFRPNPRGIVAGLLGLVGRTGPRWLRNDRVGGLVDARELERVVVDAIPWHRMGSNLQRGCFTGLSVSATHVTTGHTVVFLQRREGGVPRWSRHPFVRAEAALIGPAHALASAAIPGLFPAIRIADAFYCDGGLRQNTPLSPALRLGADRVIVVPLRHMAPPHSPARIVPEPEAAISSPFFLIGKALNALLLDHIDYDLQRLRRFNVLLDAGREAFGAEFDERVGGILGRLRGAPYRKVDSLVVRPSEDIGRLAALHVRSPSFRKRIRGVAGRFFGHLVGPEGIGEADLLSYLLFDGAFAAQLIDLGEADAARQEEAFLSLFGSDVEATCSDEP